MDLMTIKRGKKNLVWIHFSGMAPAEELWRGDFIHVSRTQSEDGSLNGCCGMMTTQCFAQMISFGTETVHFADGNIDALSVGSPEQLR